jgi:large repetitive protein
MPFFNLRNWLAPQTRRPRKARKASSTRLRLEPLEDRACPTVTIGLPAAQDTGPLNNDKYSNFNGPAPLTLQGINTDPSGNVGVFFVGMAKDGGDAALYPDPVNPVPITNFSGINWTYTITTPLEVGHVYRFIAADGLTGEFNANPDVVIDLVENSPTGLTLDPTSDSGVTGDGITNDNTPTITGLADPYPWHAKLPDDLASGSYLTTIALFADGGATAIGTGTVTNAATGAWTATVTTALSDGVHQITAKSTDAAGNVSVLSSALSITIDTTPPAIPTGLTLDPASDSGALGDNITNDSTPTITGNGVAGSVVQLFEGATALSPTAVVDAGGHWSITLSAALSDGSHTLKAKASDVAGNVSAASGGLTLTIDTTAPAAPTGLVLDPASDTPPTGDNTTSDNTPTIDGSAEPGSSVTLKDGTTTIGTATADVSGVWQVTPASPLADGVYHFTATAKDAAGNTSSPSTVLVITISTVGQPPPPPSTPVLDPGSDSGAVGDHITNDNTPTLTGTAQAGATVQIFDGATALTPTAVANGSGSWSITIGTLSDGSHSLTAKATNANGTSGASGALSLTIDTLAPAAPASLTLAPASDSGTAGDNLTNDSTPTITGAAEAGSTVKLFEGATLLGTATATGGVWSITSSTLGEGAHNLTATATDAAGNISVLSSALGITIDSVAPGAPGGLTLAPASDSGTAGDNITSDTTPTITGTAEAGSSVTLKEGSTVLGTATATGGTWSITSSALGDGSHNLTATAADAAGNVSVVSSALVLTIDTTAPAAPASLTLAPASDSGTAGDHITNDTTPTITGTAEAGSTVTLKEGATVVGTATATGGVWSITSSTLGEGAHSLTATATDAAGNISALSSALGITIDTTAPAPPTGVTLGPGGDVHTPTIVGMAPANTIVQILRDGVPVGTTTANASGAWSFTSASLPDGTYSFTAASMDPAGNLSVVSAPVVVTIQTPTQPPPPSDTTPPTILSKQFFRLGRSLGVVALHFSEALNPAAAQNVMNYWALVTGGGAKLGHPKLALYVAGSNTLYLAVDLKPTSTRVILAMLTPGAVTDLAGNGLASGILGFFSVPIRH